MASRKRPRRSGRIRIGMVTLYLHHGAWWLYYRENSSPHRQHLGQNLDDAKAQAAQVNAQLARGQRTAFSFRPVSVQELVSRWLDHHEHILRSSVATLARYRTAAEHLCRFAGGFARICAHEIDAQEFARYLRRIEVAPNGHPNAARRPLRDKGIKFILATCRSAFNYAARQHLLPPYFENPFASLPIERMPVEDAKPVHVFSDVEEAQFFSRCDSWQFPLFYVLAKTGMRPGELVHLLVEDIDLGKGLLHIRNRPQLGWQVKTRLARSIPLPAEPLAVIRSVVSDRSGGVLFRRRRFCGGREPPLCDTQQLLDELERRRLAYSRDAGREPTRDAWLRLARTVWRDAGAIKCDTIRTEFCRITAGIGRPWVTAPKCWRHTFATLLQEAGVDPLIRQQTMGHAPAGTGRGILGMTALYTHTQPEVHRQQLQRVIDLRPNTSALVHALLGDKANDIH